MADKASLSGSRPLVIRVTSTNDTVAAGEELWVDPNGATRVVALPGSPAPGQRCAVGKADATSTYPVNISGTVNGDPDGARLVTPGVCATFVWVSASLGWRVESVSTGAAMLTDLPMVEARLTAAYTALPTGDYLMVGNMTPGPDPFGMWSTAFNFYRVVAPATGRYDIEWCPFLLLFSGSAAAKVLLNVPNGTAGNTAVQNYSRLSATALPTGEGAPVNIRRTVALNAGDALAFAVFGSGQFDMPVSRFGGLETRLTVRYVGRS